MQWKYKPCDNKADLSCGVELIGVSMQWNQSDAVIKTISVGYRADRVLHVRCSYRSTAIPKRHRECPFQSGASLPPNRFFLNANLYGYGRTAANQWGKQKGKAKNTMPRNRRSKFTRKNRFPNGNRSADLGEIKNKIDNASSFRRVL